ncbi:YhfC family glutamic-type intramembrane protease [Miniphocaeibacter halophilus]|uniref:YhfC family intramembrane metalloprotease n=1 Tax=Miniphocaeibacter halophilus TaxID=2931922 RepID=A0AC61MSU0_9FIRM|nr:YhfC family glutamic-type intramembrane protease [Miniphocaeibacter halophilus]QQK08720.1 YhfC family intramembrane metalloprotease [Miniphocaeibacter halophilus]
MIGLVLSLLVIFIIPIIVVITLNRKKKVRLRNFIVGIFAFLISQTFTRLPILNLLQTKTTIFRTGLFSNLMPYIIFLSFTAGIFEETARFIAYKTILKKEKNIYSPISFGLGHGGIEAVIYTLLPILSYRYNLLFLDNLQVYLGILERVSAIIFHISATILVFYGIRKNKKVWWLISIIIHGMYNFIFTYLANVLNRIVLSEIVALILAIILLIFARYLLRKLEREESYEKYES